MFFTTVKYSIKGVTSDLPERSIIMSNSDRYTGPQAFPTMITPYKKDGSIDYDTVRRYVRWYFEQGCHGIFAICQSSEIFYLTPDEIVELNRVVWEEAKSLEKTYGRHFTIVSSGHVEDTLEEQASTLTRVWESGTEALVLITNRLDPNNEGDDVWIANAEKLLSMLPADAMLGLYECPHPYKRLLTPRILDWCLKTGRFRFIKDTCCDAAVIKSRVEQLKGSELKLYNANCQTLLETLRDGADGYSGIMCNYHPKLYAWLCEHFKDEPEKAELLQAFLCMSGCTENALPYPLSAKYHMNLAGIPTENISRVKASELLTDYVRSCMHQMKLLSDRFEEYLNK